MSASIFDESEPVVKAKTTADQAPTMSVSGNAPELRPAENPFPTSPPSGDSERELSSSEAPKESRTVRRTADDANTPYISPSSTMRAAEQLRAAAGEKARQLRAASDAKQSAEQAQAAERAKAAADQQAAAERARVAQQAQAAQQAKTEAESEERAQTAQLAAARARAAEVQARAKAEAEAAKAHARALADIPEAVSPPAVTAEARSRAAAPEPQRAQVARSQATASAAATPAAAALSPSAQEKVDEWKAVAEATWADASIVLKDIQVESERYIRENPTRAALTALGVGFVLGVLLKR